MDMDIEDVKEENFMLGKKSKAHLKMVAYLDDLLKNVTFQKKLKLLNKEKANRNNFKKFANSYSLTDKYKKLKREAQSTTKNNYNKLVENIINQYGISYEAIELAIAMQDGHFDYVKRQKHDVHLCTINDDYLNHLAPLNPADDFVALNPKLKRRILAFPISIGISPRATKADIIDFIDKNWWWINNAIQQHGLKPLRIRKRKHSKELIELIWKNRQLRLKKIGELIQAKFQKTLIYNDIQDIITYEKKKRLPK